MTGDFYDNPIIERGTKPVPVADDDPAPVRKPGRPKGSGNKAKAAPGTQQLPKDIYFRVSDATHEQFRILVIKQRTTGQAMLCEALNMLFKRYGLAQIAGQADGEET